MRSLKDRDEVSFKIEIGYLRAMADGDNRDLKSDCGEDEGFLLLLLLLLLLFLSFKGGKAGKDRSIMVGSVAGWGAYEYDRAVIFKRILRCAPKISRC